MAGTRGGEGGAFLIKTRDAFNVIYWLLRWSRDLRTYGFHPCRVERPFRYFRLCRVWSTTLREHIGIDFTIVVINGRINGNLIVESWNLRCGKNLIQGISHKFRMIKHNELWIEYELLESCFSLLSLSVFNSTILLIRQTQIRCENQIGAFLLSLFPRGIYWQILCMYLLRYIKNATLKKKKKERERECAASINGKRPGTDKWSGNY